MDGIREQQQPDEEAADPAAEASWALRRCFKVYRIEVSVRVHVVCLIREEEDESDLPHFHLRMMPLPQFQLHLQCHQ